MNGIIPRHNSPGTHRRNGLIFRHSLASNPRESLMNQNDPQPLPLPATPPDPPPEANPPPQRPKEYGGPKGPEPTRYGDWEKAGRCIDF
jgi:hypothetical protein